MISSRTVFVYADIERHKVGVYKRVVELRETDHWIVMHLPRVANSECTLISIAHERVSYLPPIASIIYTGSKYGGYAGSRSTPLEDNNSSDELVSNTLAVGPYRN